MSCNSLYHLLLSLFAETNNIFPVPPFSHPHQFSCPHSHTPVPSQSRCTMACYIIRHSLYITLIDINYCQLTFLSHALFVTSLSFANTFIYPFFLMISLVSTNSFAFFYNLLLHSFGLFSLISHIGLKIYFTIQLFFKLVLI